MNRVIIASMHHGAGKTSVILGLANAVCKRCAYMKPFGDRLVYTKKRLWDHDASLLTKQFDLGEDPEDISIGFDHSKLWYMYDQESIKGKLHEILDRIEKGKDLVFIEGGEDLVHGTSVHLDVVSLARSMDAKLLFVLAGDEGSIVDDAVFLKGYLDSKKVGLTGVIINKVQNLQDFTENHLPRVTDLGIKVLGVIPFMTEMTYVTVDQLASMLFAKVITGEAGLGNKVKSVFVGAMSAKAAQRTPYWKKDNMLLITSGDRHEIVLAALDADTSGIVLTNDVLPPPNIISKASEKGIPLLLMPQDTFKVAKMIDDMEPILTQDDTRRMDLIKRAVTEHVNIDLIKGDGKRTKG